MSKKEINIKENVMKKIHEDKISMKPKSYFVLGSLFTFVGLIASVISSVFLISIISFLLKTHGPMGEYKFSLMINSFPWWVPILAIVGLIFGIWFLRKYDFSYKTNFWVIIIGFIIVVIVAGWAIDRAGVDRLWLNQGPMRGIMRQYIQDDSSWQNSNKPYYQPKKGSGQGNGYGKITR